MPHPVTRLSVRVGRKEFDNHSFYSMPRVVTNITRTDAIQVDLGIADCVSRIPLNSLRISFRTQEAFTQATLYLGC